MYRVAQGKGNFVPSTNKQTQFQRPHFNSTNFSKNAFTPSFTPSFTPTLKTPSYPTSPSYPSFSYPSLTPLFKKSPQTLNNLSLQQKRSFSLDVHPFFQNAIKNIKKKMYHRFNNIFLPGQEKVNVSVYHVFSPWLYFDWRKQQKLRWRKVKTKLHSKLAINYPILYRFIYVHLQKKVFRMSKPRRQRRPRIYTSTSPERVEELLPNRKRVLFDGLGKHPEYEEHLFYLKNLTHKYYQDKKVADWDNDLNVEKFCNEYLRQPQHPRGGLFAHSEVKVNKRDKTTALIEGCRKMEIRNPSKVSDRIQRKFPKVFRAWRAVKQTFRKFRREKRSWERYLILQNPEFHPMAIKAFGHKVKKAVILFLDKGDPTYLLRIQEPYEKGEEQLLLGVFLDDEWEEDLYGSASSNPQTLYGGFRRQQTIKTTKVRFKGFRYFDDADNIIFYCKFRRLYTSLKRKYRLRRQRVFFQIIWDMEDKTYYLRNLRIRYRRRRKTLG